MLAGACPLGIQTRSPDSTRPAAYSALIRLRSYSCFGSTLRSSFATWGGSASALRHSHSVWRSIVAAATARHSSAVPQASERSLPRRVKK